MSLPAIPSKGASELAARHKTPFPPTGSSPFCRPQGSPSPLPIYPLDLELSIKQTGRLKIHLLRGPFAPPASRASRTTKASRALKVNHRGRATGPSPPWPRRKRRCLQVKPPDSSLEPGGTARKTRSAPTGPFCSGETRIQAWGPGEPSPYPIYLTPSRYGYRAMTSSLTWPSSTVTLRKW